MISKTKIHIVISRTPLKKKISRRHDKNINRTDKMDTKKRKTRLLDSARNRATKSRQDKSNNKIIYLNPCILVILTDVNGLNILIQRKRLSD